MKSSTPTWLLAALGVLTVPAFAADPSEWKCENCPFDEGLGIHGSVDVGAGYVSKDAAKFGDYTGLDKKGAFAVLGGAVRYRSKDGVYGGIAADELGLDSRSLTADHGREGRYSVWLGYSEIPHRLTDSALTPFLGGGGAVLTLPAGFPAPTTADMPLAATLQRTDIGFDRQRLEVGGALIGGREWSYRVDVRRDVRDGTQRGAGSFFSNASQFVLPLDQATDRIDAIAAYNGRRLQASLSYHGSLFHDRLESLTWQNPFTPIVGATAGQLALAPDNEFHQVAATLGYQFGPTLRASAEIALGRMTQNEAFLQPTLNTTLVMPALPAQSLRGRVDTLDATLRVSADPIDRLRLTAVLSRNERDNQTTSLVYPSVSTDMFVGVSRANQPYGFTRDRARLTADFRGPGSIKMSAGAEYDVIERTLQETDETREGSVWARASVRPLDNVTVAVKGSHAERDNDGYRVLAYVQPPENPLLRKFNLADRRRDTVGARVDATLGESVTLGLGVDYADDDYTDSPIGLTRSRSGSVSFDGAVAIAEDTRLRLYGQAERVRSRQAGSEQFGAPDWTGRVRDEVDTIGVGVTHAAMGGKLELGGDVAWSRSRSDVTVRSGTTDSPFPTAKTALDSLKLFANYKLKDNLTLLGSYWVERYDAADWRLAGVLPATVPNLLAFGEQSPHYTVHVLRLAARYAF